jgi:hypothetical protein
MDDAAGFFYLIVLSPLGIDAGTRPNATQG